MALKPFITVPINDTVKLRLSFGITILLTLDYLSDSSYQNLNKLYGIDKTEFIHKILTDHHSALCFLKPKGFLQSTLMAMLANFLDLKQGQIIDAFFKRTVIVTFPQSAAQQGKWPVIHFDLSGLTEATTKEEFDQYLNQLINYYYQKYEVEKSRDGEQPLKALLNLIKGLYAKYQRKSYIIINGVDEPFHFDGMQSIRILWMEILSNTVKNNPFVETSALCGVMRPGTYAVEGSMNNYHLVNPVDYNPYNKYFGFTAKEAELIAQAESIDEQTVKQLRKLVGGFHYSANEMIQPDAVLPNSSRLTSACQYPYLSQILKNPHLTNWLDSLLDSYLKQKPIHFYFVDSAIYYPIESPRYGHNELLSLLVLCGFLTPVAPDSNLFKIPNKQRYQQLYQCLVQQQIKTPQMIISQGFFSSHSQTLFAQKTLMEKRQFVIATTQEIIRQDEKRALKIWPLMKNDEELKKAYAKIEKFYSYNR